jgi:nucleotide-binding universal stress UspA family protein
MNNKRRANPFKRIFLLFLVLPVFVNNGCQKARTVPGEEVLPAYDIKKIAVMGFKPAVDTQGDLGDNSVPASFEKSLYYPSLLDKSQYITIKLYEVMGKRTGYEVISPEKANALLSEIIAAEPGIRDMEAFIRVAHELHVDAIAVGSLYRWRDREGSDYAVNNPASVFF